VLRGDPALAGLKLIAVTGYARPEDIAAAREAGFDHHIAKPALIPDLERAMDPAEPSCESTSSKDGGRQR
jgi:CheY-like chemotaxis protein